MFVDTHCHIHDPDYSLDVAKVITRANKAGVDKMICIGTDVNDSINAIKFAESRDGVFASIGVHPHNSKDGAGGLEALIDGKIVAIGEIGLDYHYNFSSRQDQIRVFESQINLALYHDLPIIFHVRDAFDDFWSIIDNFCGIRGELHSFTDSRSNLEEGLKRGLYIGVNGFSTFVKDQSQKEMFATIPLERLLLETDAPYLTPVPFRGKINEPMYVKDIAEFHANVRSLSIDEIASRTTQNAEFLFGI